jgi:hypothetical protein
MLRFSPVLSSYSSVRSEKQRTGENLNILLGSVHYLFLFHALFALYVSFLMMWTVSWRKLGSIFQ